MLNLNMPVQNNLLPAPGFSVADMIWKNRELDRFASGEYARIVGSTLNFQYDHFIHWSKKSPGKIAFTQSIQHGRDDRQTVIKLGKYIARYFPDIAPHVVRDIVAQLQGALIAEDLQFLTSAGDIYHAYEDINGGSCMRVGHRSLESDTHPSQCYADQQGVAIAHIQGVGRGVVNVEQKTYFKIYGDNEKFMAILESVGYSKNDKGLEGLTLGYIEENGQIILPYLDGTQNVELCRSGDNSHYWRVGGALPADNGTAQHDTACGVNGFSERSDDEHTMCHSCDGRVSHDDTFYVESEDIRICESCLNGDDYERAFGDRANSEIVSVSNTSVFLYDGYYYTLEGLAWHDLIMDNNGEVFPQSEVAECHITNEIVHLDNVLYVYSVSAGGPVYISDDEVDAAYEVPAPLQDYCDGCDKVIS